MNLSKLASDVERLFGPSDVDSRFPGCCWITLKNEPSIKLELNPITYDVEVLQFTLPCHNRDALPKIFDRLSVSPRMETCEAVVVVQTLNEPDPNHPAATWALIRLSEFINTFRSIRTLEVHPWTNRNSALIQWIANDVLSGVCPGIKDLLLMMYHPGVLLDAMKKNQCQNPYIRTLTIDVRSRDRAVHEAGRQLVHRLTAWVLPNLVYTYVNVNMNALCVFARHVEFGKMPTPGPPGLVLASPTTVSLRRYIPCADRGRFDYNQPLIIVDDNDGTPTQRGRWLIERNVLFWRVVAPLLRSFRANRGHALMHSLLPVLHAIGVYDEWGFEGIQDVPDYVNFIEGSMRVCIVRDATDQKQMLGRSTQLLDVAKLHAERGVLSVSTFLDTRFATNVVVEQPPEIVAMDASQETRGAKRSVSGN